MAKSPTGEVSFTSNGETFTLVFDFAALAYFERETNVSVYDALGDMQSAQAEGRTPKVSQLALLLQAGLRRHHPTLAPQDTLAFLADEGVLDQLGVALDSAMPGGDETADEGNAKAPAKKKASTGTKRSRARSKRG